MTMMRRHARSESPKIIRKFPPATPITGESQEFGSTVLTMPSTGGRRSTRVFVPKVSLGSRAVGAGNRVVEGGIDGESEWISFFGGDKDGNVRWYEDGIEEGSNSSCNLVGDDRVKLGVRGFGAGNSPKFGLVYGRKRRRGSSSGTYGEDSSSSSCFADDGDSRRNGRFGLVFSRMEPGKKRKVISLEGDVVKEGGACGRLNDVGVGSSEVEQRVDEATSQFVVAAEVFIDDMGMVGEVESGEIEPRIDDDSRRLTLADEISVDDAEIVAECESCDIESRVDDGSRRSTVTDEVLIDDMKVVGEGESVESDLRIDDVVSVIGGQVMLTFLIESSSASDQNCFPQLLVRILRQMRRGRLDLRKFVAFLLGGGSLTSVFSRHGVHILPISLEKDNDLSLNFLRSCGVCKIYGNRKSSPSLQVGFLSLPSYFKTLHISLLVGSLCISASLATSFQPLCTDQHVEVQFEEKNYDASAVIGCCGNKLSPPEFSSFQSDKCQVVLALESVIGYVAQAHLEGGVMKEDGDCGWLNDVGGNHGEVEHRVADASRQFPVADEVFIDDVEMVGEVESGEIESRVDDDSRRLAMADKVLVDDAEFVTECESCDIGTRVDGDSRRLAVAGKVLVEDADFVGVSEGSEIELRIDHGSRRYTVADEVFIDELKVVGEGESGESDLRIADGGRRRFAVAAGILIDDMVSVIGGQVMLTFLVESSASDQNCFPQLLVGILRQMRSGRFDLRKFAAFLLGGGSLASVFSRHGVHILPTSLEKDIDLSPNVFHSRGVCKIYGTRKSSPSLQVGFLSLPSYFKTLHISLLVGNLHISAALARTFQPICTDRHVEVQSEETVYNASAVIVYKGNKLPLPEISLVQWDRCQVVLARESIVGNVDRAHLELKNHKRKRSSPRFSRKQNLSYMQFSDRNNVGIVSETEPSLISDIVLEPIQAEVSDALTDDSSCLDESDISTPVGSRNGHKNTVKRAVVDHVKEKTDLAKVRQNIMTARCKANVLASVCDRCWREEGFEVMLDLSSTGECLIVVKSKDDIRYSHKPQDLKPCVVNRFTRSYMWKAEDGWKLEFLKRWDWLVFKELHMECWDRNRLEVFSKMIPVPGVLPVSGYDEHDIVSFVRSDEYISVKDVEVKRALEGKMCIYDMDSDDEAWLINWNAILSQTVTAAFSYVSEEQFENIISTFEKDAYRNVDALFEKERALEFYHGLADRDTLSSIYDYWRTKRNKRRAALARVFLGSPLRKVQIRRKSFISKKQNFKRQRIQPGRQNQEVTIEVEEKDEASLQRVREAECAADIAVKSAINLRNRAQILMANAELAVYKSVMALRIADAIRVSGSCEFTSSLLDLDGEAGSEQ